MSHRWWAQVGVASYSCVIGALYLLRPSGPDLATFDYIGWIVSQGGTLYVDVIEQNWPGAIWLHTLSNELFGQKLWAFRAIDFALLLVGCGGLFKLASLGGAPLTRYLVVPIYQSIYVGLDEWTIGQRDFLAAHVLLAIAALHAARMTRGTRFAPPVVGIGMALVVLTRPTFALYFPLLYAVDLWQREPNQRSLARVAVDAAIAGTSFVLVLGVIALLGLRSGALAGWYQAAVLFNALIYSQTASLLELFEKLFAVARNYHWVVGLAIFGALGWWRRGERNAWAVGLLLGVTGLTSMFVQGKAFGYHLGAVFAVGALFAADAVGTALMRAYVRRTALQRCIAVLVCALALAGSLKKAHRGLHDQLAYVTGEIDAETYYTRLDVGLHVSLRDVLRAVAYARAHSRPDQTVLTWNRAVIINHLAQRRLPTPVATVGMLDLARVPFPSLEHWLDDFEHTLRVAPPALVFAYNAQLPKQHALLWGKGGSGRATALVRATLSERYRLDARFGALDVYTLK